VSAISGFTLSSSNAPHTSRLHKQVYVNTFWYTFVSHVHELRHTWVCPVSGFTFHHTPKIAYISLWKHLPVHLHITCAWVMSHVHESCHMCIRHVTCVWVMSHVSESYLWLHFIFLQCTHTHPRLHKPIYGNTFRYTSVSHVYKSCRMRRRHITRVWVILLVYESYNMSEWVLFRASHCFPSRKISCRSVATRRRKICGILSAVTGVGLDNIQTQSVSSFRHSVVHLWHCVWRYHSHPIFDTVSEDTTLTQSLTLCLKIPLSSIFDTVLKDTVSEDTVSIFDTVSEDTTVVHLRHCAR